MPPILTHFDDDLKIDHEAIAAQVERLIAAEIDGVVACGTMGEATSLSPASVPRYSATVVGAAAGRVPVCAGISAPSAAQAIVHARDAVAASADSLMVLAALPVPGRPSEAPRVLRRRSRAQPTCR